MRMSLWMAAVVLLAFQFSTASADEKVITVLKGLDNPSGVAIEPGSGNVFISDSGAGRVVRVVDGKAVAAITGFPQDIYGKGPMYNIGPLGLVFLDQKTLVVGGGGYKDGAELLRVYTVPKAGDSAIDAGKMKASLGPLTATDELKGEGNFYGVAAGSNAIYVTCNGDDTKGWISRVKFNGDKFGKYERFIATKEAVEVDAPVGITLSPRGEVVVGQMGEMTVPQDSLLSFYNSSGKLLMNLETGLFDIAALAYSPKGKLYALDFAWMDTTQGGLYRLDASSEDGKQTVKAVKIASLDKPAAMAFGADGSLYIAVFGTAKDGDSAKPGKLVKIGPGL